MIGGRPGAERDHTKIRDTGPDKPIQPVPPPIPAGKEGDPTYELAKVKFKYALMDYDLAYAKYRHENSSFEGGYPKIISVWTSDLKEIMERDARAVAEGRQRARRYSKVTA